MPTVHNKHHQTAPPDAVYIGRPSVWGNPYSHRSDTLAEFRVKTTDEALTEYQYMMMRTPKLVTKARRELKGKDLVCFCKPGPCHGDILMRIANSKGADW
jgi:hypothetical protein